MGEGFNKFKRKIIIETLIKSIAFGLSFGLICVAVSLLITKTKADVWEPLFYALLGGGTFIAISFLAYLVLKPNEIKIAKRLDKDLALNEKVETMVKFANEDGLIINLQREDTKSRLAQIGLDKLAMKIGLFFIILPLVTLSFCVTAIIIPAKEDNPTNSETETIPFEMDDWSIAAIRDLIEVVSKSTLAENVKIAYITELEALIEVLLETKTQGLMQQEVLKTIDAIYFELDKINSDNELFTILNKSTESMILTLAIHIDNLDINNVGNALDSIQAMVNGTDIPSNCAQIDEYLGKTLEKSNANKDDLLYIALTELSDKMTGCQTSDDLKTVFDECKPKVLEAVKEQKANEDMAIYIEETLKDIFGISDGSEEETNPTDSETSGSQPNISPTEPTLPTEGGQGGLGSGETQYGSNDAFYDPDLGEVLYGDVIDDYYADIYNKMLDGSIPKELADYFEKYFDALYGSNKNDEKEE